MWSICIKEYSQLFKSFKSIFVMAFLIGTSFLFAAITEQLPMDEIGMNPAESFAAGNTFIVIFLGAFFVALLSNDSISREVQYRTIRFLATKTKRKNIALGKLLGITLF